MSNLKDVTEQLTRQVKNYEGGDKDVASWKYEEGVLISFNEAREALAAIESRDAFVAALISQAKETAYRIAMHIYRDREGQQELAMKHAHDFWQDYLTEPARAVLVKAGKITEQ